MNSFFGRLLVALRLRKPQPTPRRVLPTVDVRRTPPPTVTRPSATIRAFPARATNADPQPTPTGGHYDLVDYIADKATMKIEAAEARRSYLTGNGWTPNRTLPPAPAPAPDHGVPLPSGWVAAEPEPFGSRSDWQCDRSYDPDPPSNSSD